MPCSECGEPLLVSSEYENLRCPYCCGLDVADPEDLQDEIETTREILSDDRVISLLEDYSKNNLLLYLINELNQTAHDLYKTRGMQIERFAYLSKFIRLIYPEDGFGDKQLDPDSELADPIESVLDSEIKVFRELDHLEDKSKYAVPNPVERKNPKTFFGNYHFFESEYSYCRRRCLRSLLAGQKNNLDIFDQVSEQIRDFNSPDGGEIETIEDFADTFFEFIIGISLMMSADDTVDDIHGDRLPDGADILDLKEMIERIDRHLGDSSVQKIHEDGTLAVLDRATLEAIGKQVFDDWNRAREALVLGENDLDAHPYLFEVEYDKTVRDPPGRPPVTITQPAVVYPRHYAFLMRFQLFPLMTEDGALLGHDILEETCCNRGDKFEYNIYDYLKSEGYEAYQGAWYTKADQREIDVIAVNESDDELWFIECKYFLPELQMGRAAGIQALNQKYDSRLFPDDGESFPEKVEQWVDSKPGDTFLSHGDSARSTEEYRQEWADYDVRLFVVSNLTPSYIRKQGIEFLTDLEFVEMVNGELNLYSFGHRT